MSRRQLFLLLTALAFFIFLSVFRAWQQASPEISWDMINVNANRLQGDAHLLRVGEKVVLIDAGYYSEAKSDLVPFLQAQGVETIHYFFISHPHLDHYEGRWRSLNQA